MSIKKKIGGAIMATALGAALIGGGSYALFTAEAVNSGNTFTTGGVTITAESSTLSSTHYFDNLAPGDTETWTVTVENTDTLDAWVQVKDFEYGGTGLFDGGVNQLKILEDNDPIRIPAGGSAQFEFEYDFPKDAGNEYQGKTGELTINFQAVQARNNTKADNSGPISWE